MYEPKGKMLTWLAAMRAQPDRLWSSREAAQALGINVKKVGGYATYAIAHGVIFQSKRGKGVLYALKPFEGFLPPPKAIPTARYRPRTIPKWEPGDDIRVPQVVAGWKPPVMVPPRGRAA